MGYRLQVEGVALEIFDNDALSATYETLDDAIAAAESIRADGIDRQEVRDTDTDERWYRIAGSAWIYGGAAT